MPPRVWSVTAIAAAAALFLMVAPVAAQVAPPPLAPPSPAQIANYVVGPQDVLIITSYDQPDLTGKFTVETDGTFTYPLIGRVRVGGMTLRGVEEILEKELVAQGFFKDPQVT